jgi:sugar fermentation stimulation protein A
MFPRGVYVIVLDLPKKEIEVGSLGKLGFEGWYAYVGSNQGGGRIRRHLRKGKKMKWHIDYLTEVGEVKIVMTLAGGKFFEEELANRLAKKFEVVKGFGNSDSSAPGHLFKFSEDVVEEIERFAKEKDVEFRPWRGL